MKSRVSKISWTLLFLAGSAIAQTSQESTTSTVDATLHCPPALRDGATGGCIGASSVPQIGMLYPLSIDFYVDPTTGNVGLGNTLPGRRLDVSGNIGASVSGGGVAIAGYSNGTSLFLDAGVYGYGDRYGIVGKNGSTIGAAIRADHAFDFDTYAELARGDQTGIFATGTNLAGEFLGDVELLGTLVSTLPGATYYAHLGFLDGTLDFAIRNFHSNGGLRFDLNTASEANWEFRRRTSSGGSDVEARLTRLGHLQIDGSVSSPAADLAEYYPAQGVVEPGDVVAFADGGTLVRAGSHEPETLAGIISSDPAFIMGLSYSVEEEVPADGRVERPIAEEIQLEGRAPLALAGRVPCKVTAENGRIRAGDLLTVSSLPGHAAKAIQSGPMVGTALEAWDAGEGFIEVFVNVGWFSPDADDRIQRLEAKNATLEAAVESLRAEFRAAHR